MTSVNESNEFDKAGFELIETGGGCTAYLLGDVDGEHILITEKDEASIPISSESEITIGYYSDGDGVYAYTDNHEHAVAISLAIIKPTEAAEKQLAEEWVDYFNVNGVAHPNAISFEFEGTDIVNPFTSACGRFEVDPLETYGEKFLAWKKEVAEAKGAANEL